MTHTTCTETQTPNTTQAGLIVTEWKRRKNTSPAMQTWLDEPYNSVRGETSLWVAVITQAMMDALSRSRHPEQQYHKQEALRWLTENSKDFHIVCYYAGMDPDYVRRKAKKSLVSPVAWRAAPGQGKRYLERRTYRQRIKKVRGMTNNEEDMRCDPLPAAGECQIIAGPWR